MLKKYLAVSCALILLLSFVFIVSCSASGSAAYKSAFDATNQYVSENGNTFVFANIDCGYDEDGIYSVSNEDGNIVLNYSSDLDSMKITIRSEFTKQFDFNYSNKAWGPTLQMTGTFDNTLSDSTTANDLVVSQYDTSYSIANTVKPGMLALALLRIGYVLEVAENTLLSKSGTTLKSFGFSNFNVEQKTYPEVDWTAIDISSMTSLEAAKYFDISINYSEGKIIVKSAKKNSYEKFKDAKINIMLGETSRAQVWRNFATIELNSHGNGEYTSSQLKTLCSYYGSTLMISENGSHFYGDYYYGIVK